MCSQKVMSIIFILWLNLHGLPKVSQPKDLSSPSCNLFSKGTNQRYRTIWFFVCLFWMMLLFVVLKTGMSLPSKKKTEKTEL